MKFGMFLELQPRPGVDTSEREVFQRELELGILAEKLGFDYVWMCEHHNIPERAYCSVPEIFLTALSQHTSTIRLGFAVLELIPPINHVIRAAERVAALDIMSGGRVDVAVAPIRVAQDLGPFSVKADEVEDMVEEGLRLLPRLWGEEPVSHDGKYYHLSSVRVVPKPLQKPHPPLWQASTARHHAKVGGRGMGLLTSTHNAGYKHIGTYREALKDCTPLGGSVNSQVGVLINACCQADDRTALEIGERAELWWWDTLERLHPGSGQHKAPGTFQERLAQGHFLMGGPERCIETITMFEEMGVDMMLTWFRYGPTPEPVILEGVKVYGEKVIAHFK